VRLAVAGHRVLDETTAAKVERYEASDLSERHKAALRLADALMTQPGDMASSLVAQLKAHFTDAQLRELTLDVMKWNYQKVMVALRTDGEVRPDELVDLVYDDRGNWVRSSAAS
jgi:hypothetical protein